MNPDKAYRVTVLPLSVFLVLGGTWFAVWVWVLRFPITGPLPFVRGEELNRHLFGMLSLICVAIGVGLFFRKRIAWYALLGYLGFGAALPAIAPLDAEFLTWRGWEFAVFGTLLNVVAAAGLYFAVRPTFKRAQAPIELDPSTDRGGDTAKN